MRTLARLAVLTVAVFTMDAVSIAQMGIETDGDLRDPAHDRYSDCTPPKNFADRFPGLTLQRGLKRVSSSTIHESPSLIATRNPVTGTRVTSENLYVRRVFGIIRYGNDHTFAAISQPLEEPRAFSMMVSNTNYSQHNKQTADNELAELYVPLDGKIVTVPLSGSSESGYCTANENGIYSCFSTGYSHFNVDPALFQALAESDPQEAIAVTSKRLDGTMSACPLYFSPLSFKAVLLSIDEAYEEAAEKRERQRAEGF